MSTVTKKAIRQMVTFSAACGNAWTENFQFATNASGVFVDSDKATAVASCDVVRIGILPAGLSLQTAIVAINDAFTAASTGKLGFAYVDGVDDATVPQDDDYFIVATSLATAARLVANNPAVKPVKLPKDAYLVLTNGGATQAAAGELTAMIFGVLSGV